MKLWRSFQWWETLTIHCKYINDCVWCLRCNFIRNNSLITLLLLISCTLSTWFHKCVVQSSHKLQVLITTTTKKKKNHSLHYFAQNLHTFYMVFKWFIAKMIHFLHETLLTQNETFVTCINKFCTWTETLFKKYRTYMCSGMLQGLWIFVCTENYLLRP